MEHLDFHLLVDFVTGTLSSTDRSSAEDHLATCAVCQQELEIVQRTLAAIEKPQLENPPNGLMQRALAAFRHKQTRLTERIQQAANLEFDSWTTLALGARGAAQDRQLLYSLGAYDLDVQVFEDRTTRLLILRGQILPVDSEEIELMGLEVRLIGAHIDERRTLTDELGQFSLAGLAAGTYELQIVFDDYDAVLRSLTIEP